MQDRERNWPRKLEKREKEKVLSILEPVVSRGVLLSKFVRENWLRERNLSVKRDREKTKSRLNEREEAILLSKERKKLNKIMPKNYSTFVHTEPFVEHHCIPC